MYIGWLVMDDVEYWLLIKDQMSGYYVVVYMNSVLVVRVVDSDMLLVSCVDKVQFVVYLQIIFFL